MVDTIENKQHPLVQKLLFWRTAMLKMNAPDMPDLSTRQITIALHVYTNEPPHRVRDIARILQFSKPSVTRGLDRLAEFDLIRRKEDHLDGRSVLIQPTLKGAQYLQRLADIVDEALIHIHDSELESVPLNHKR